MPKWAVASRNSNAFHGAVCRNDFGDTSVWIDHLRQNDPVLESLLEEGGVLLHPFIIGELAVGNLQPRDAILRRLGSLPLIEAVDDHHVLVFVTRYKLFGLGIGYIDCHLLASAEAVGISLWTRDKRLRQAAHTIGLRTQPEAYVN